MIKWFAGGAPLPNAALSHPWRVFVVCGGEDSGSEDWFGGGVRFKWYASLYQNCSFGERQPNTSHDFNFSDDEPASTNSELPKTADAVDNLQRSNWPVQLTLVTRQWKVNRQFWNCRKKNPRGNSPCCPWPVVNKKQEKEISRAFI